MAREPIPTWFFVVTVVHRDGRYLLLKEKKHRGWYFPAGRVELGEALEDAALRETREETGVEVVLEGLLRFEHGPTMGGVRVRVFFLARPVDGSEPRRTDDNDGARRRRSRVAARRADDRGRAVARSSSSDVIGGPVTPSASRWPASPR